MSDLIERQAAIDTVVDAMMSGADADMVEGLIYMLPSAQPKSYREGHQAGFKDAQPERKRGQWIKVNGKTAINCSACYHCSWSRSFEDTVKRFNFCPYCGADMREDDHG